MSNPSQQSGSAHKIQTHDFWPTKETFLNVFNFSAVGMGLVGLDGRWLKTNRAVQNLFGFAEEDLRARTLLDLTQPDDRAASVERMRQLTNAEADSFPVRNRFVQRDGRLIWALLSLSLVRDAAGEPDYLIAQIQDISEQKGAEEALIWKAAFFEAKFKSSPDGILMVDQGLKIIVENKRMDQLGKMPPGQESPNATMRISCLSQTTKDPEGFLKRLTDLTAHPLETSRDNFYLKDGTTLEQYTSPVCGEDGVLYGRIWRFRDVTETIRVRDRLERLFSMTPDLIFIAGYDGYFKETNPAVTKILGFSPQELRAIPFLNFVLEEDRAGVGEVVQETLKNGHSSDFGTRLRCKDGAIKWLEVNAVAVPAEQLLFATARDVTERKLAEQELARVKREHDRVLSAVGDGVHWIGLNGQIKFENPAGAKMLGSGRPN